MIKAEKLITWSELSDELTGDKHRIREDYCPKLYQGIIKRLTKSIQRVLDNQINKS